METKHNKQFVTDGSIRSKDCCRHNLSYSDRDFFKQIINKGILELAHDRIDGLVSDKKKIYEHMAENEGEIIEGVRPFLAHLSEQGLPMAICSGALKPEIELILEKSQLRHHFKTIVSADQVENSKPDPEGYRLTLSRLNEMVGPMTADECVVFEDSHWGIEAAQAAGMRTVAVTNSYPADQLSMANHVVDRLDQMTVSDLEGLCGNESG